MSYMKKWWMELQDAWNDEMEKMACDPVMEFIPKTEGLWKVKKPWQLTVDFGDLEKKVAAQISAGVLAPIVHNRLVDCLNDIDFHRHFTMTCLNCNDTSHVGRVGNPEILVAEDVYTAEASCIRCGWRGSFKYLIAHTAWKPFCMVVDAWVKQLPLPGVTAAMVEGFGPPCCPPPTRKSNPESTCEADKPEGTRDVDKFLREQQNKLWELD